MPRTKRASPGIGHGDNLPDSAAVRAALATEVIFQQKKEALREQHKRARKGMEANGVPLADLDTLYKLRDEPDSEIEAWFRRKFAVLGAVFSSLGEQVD